MNTPPRKLLVLDLDETLVHSTATELEHAADFSASATCCPSLLTYLGGDLAPWRISRT
jgi:NLI interacting factor-like phosphatase